MIIAHTADSHVGPSGSQLDRETGLNARMMDRARCLEFVIQDSIHRGAELILFAGDFWAGPGEIGLGCRPTPTQVHLVREALRIATGEGLPVVAILGNHDAAKGSNEWHAFELLADMPGLRTVDKPCLLNVWRHHHGEIGHDGEAFEYGSHSVEPLEMSPADGADLQLQLACLPFPNANLLLRDEEVRKLDPGERNLRIRELMMDCARGLAAQRIERVPCLLLGHFAVDVAEAGTQNRLMMLGGEWTLNLQEVEALGFDACLLGHVHKPQNLGSGTVYSGSPEACGFGEEGEEKRYVLWSELRPGIFEIASFPTPYRRLVTIHISDFSETMTEEACLPLRYPEKLIGAIVRLEIPPDSRLTVDEARRAIDAAGAFEARVTKARSETVRRRESEISASMGFTEALEEWLKQKPDLRPLSDAIITEAHQVDAALREGGAA